MDALVQLNSLEIQVIMTRSQRVPVDVAYVVRLDWLADFVGLRPFDLLDRFHLLDKMSAKDQVRKNEQVFPVLRDDSVAVDRVPITEVSDAGAVLVPLEWAKKVIEVASAGAVRALLLEGDLDEYSIDGGRMTDRHGKTSVYKIYAVTSSGDPVKIAVVC
jgi:hypothetical protein